MCACASWRAFKIVEVEEGLEAQSFRNLVTFFAEELRDIHAGKTNAKKSLGHSTKPLIKHGALKSKKGHSSYRLTEKALKVLEGF